MAKPQDARAKSGRDANLFAGKLPNYYAVLKIGRNATPEEVRRAYIAIARTRHPDAGATADVELYRVATEAYAVLRDERKRNAYNAKLKELALPCNICMGTGVLRRQKGLTTVVHYACTSCDGTGLKKWKTE
jgi:DnaJ-class molecular chaperone